MSPKVKRDGNSKADAKPAPTHDEIRSRAYEIYRERGSLPGREVEDWLQAERELETALSFTATLMEIKE
jgi:hypothetical protein